MFSPSSDYLFPHNSFLPCLGREMSYFQGWASLQEFEHIWATSNECIRLRANGWQVILHRSPYRLQLMICQLYTVSCIIYPKRPDNTWCSLHLMHSWTNKCPIWVSDLKKQPRKDGPGSNLRMIHVLAAKTWQSWLMEWPLPIVQQ